MCGNNVNEPLIVLTLNNICTYKYFICNVVSQLYLNPVTFNKDLHYLEKKSNESAQTKVPVQFTAY